MKHVFLGFAGLTPRCSACCGHVGIMDNEEECPGIRWPERTLDDINILEKHWPSARLGPLAPEMIERITQLRALLEQPLQPR